MNIALIEWDSSFDLWDPTPDGNKGISQGNSLLMGSWPYRAKFPAWRPVPQLVAT